MKIFILALTFLALVGVSLVYAGGDLDVSQFGYNTDGNGQMEVAGATGTATTTEASDLAAAEGVLGSRGFQLFLVIAAVLLVISLLVWAWRKSTVPAE